MYIYTLSGVNVKAFFLSFSLCVLASASLADCPAYIEKSELKAAGLNINPTATKLFSFEKNAGWKQHALQAVGLDDNGLLDLRHNAAPAEIDLENYRLVFDDTVFGEEAPRSMVPPCAFRRRFMIKRDRAPHELAYLFWCKEEQKPLAAADARFQFDSSTRTVEGPFYGYAYNKKNNIMFDDIWLNGGGGRVSVARNSQLKIRADVKRFFSLNFGINDIESRLKHQYAGPIAFVSTLDFFLNIFFFKINLELNTSLGFFNRSVNVPMILHMPVDASRWVYPGSGIFYAWESNDLVVSYDLAASRIPQFNAELIKQGYEAVGRKGLQYCDERSCMFDLVFRLERRPVTMQFRMPRYMVERGFYPVFVADVRAAEKALNWPRSEKTNSGWRQAAVYFENSGTTEGEHKWDFWLNINENEQGLSTPCPVKSFSIHKW